MATFNPSNFGQFLPTSQLQTQQELFDFADNAAYVINTKTSGFYLLEEVMNHELFFATAANRTNNNTQTTYRQIFRKVIDFGTLPNNTTKSVAHGITITAQTRFKEKHGEANDPVNFVYKTLPYASPTLSENIEFYVNATNVVVTTGKDQTAFTDTYIILEYVKEA